MDEIDLGVSKEELAAFRERDREIALSTAGLAANGDAGATDQCPELASMKFLIADESRFYRAVIKNALAAFRITRVIEAADGGAALQALKSSQVDFVLTDYNMPVLNGIEFVRMVRWSEETGLNPEVPIIMITETAEHSVVLEARNAGVHEFLCKPLVPRDLFDRIRKTIRSPRPFISVESYRGPDRRWMDREAPAGSGQAA
jgi:PleD family two-component response regulator